MQVIFTMLIMHMSEYVYLLFRYHVKCDGTKLLYYSVIGQSMQDTANCSGLTDVCVDKLKLIFPGVGECERCSTMSNSINSASSCVDRSGLGNEMFVEFTANRETDLPGFEIFAYCIEPGFSQNNIFSDGIGKRQAEQCTSPNGIGPRDLPALPPLVSSATLKTIIMCIYTLAFQSCTALLCYYESV